MLSSNHNLSLYTKLVTVLNRPFSRDRSKRGQEGIISEAKFLCWKFPVVKPNFVIFFDEVL